MPGLGLQTPPFPPGPILPFHQSELVEFLSHRRARHGLFVLPLSRVPGRDPTQGCLHIPLRTCVIPGTHQRAHTLNAGHTHVQKKACFDALHS